VLNRNFAVLVVSMVGGINRVQKTHDLLIASGYELIHSDRGANFLYSYERSLV